jgi:hypothetical protein
MEPRARRGPSQPVPIIIHDDDIHRRLEICATSSVYLEEVKEIQTLSISLSDYLICQEMVHWPIYYYGLQGLLTLKKTAIVLKIFQHLWMSLCSIEAFIVE